MPRPSLSDRVLAIFLLAFGGQTPFGAALVVWPIWGADLAGAVALASLLPNLLTNMWVVWYRGGMVSTGQRVTVVPWSLLVQISPGVLQFYIPIFGHRAFLSHVRAIMESRARQRQRERRVDEP